MRLSEAYITSTSTAGGVALDFAMATQMYSGDVDLWVFPGGARHKFYLFTKSGDILTGSLGFKGTQCSVSPNMYVSLLKCPPAALINSTHGNPFP